MVEDGYLTGTPVRLFPRSAQSCLLAIGILVYSHIWIQLRAPSMTNLGLKASQSSINWSVSTGVLFKTLLGAVGAILLETGGESGSSRVLILYACALAYSTLAVLPDSLSMQLEVYEVLTQSGSSLCGMPTLLLTCVLPLLCLLALNDDTGSLITIATLIGSSLGVVLGFVAPFFLWRVHANEAITFEKNFKESVEQIFIAERHPFNYLASCSPIF